MFPASDRYAWSTAPEPVALVTVALGAEVYPLPALVTLMVRIAPSGTVWGVVTVVLTLPTAAVAPVPPPPAMFTTSPTW